MYVNFPFQIDGRGRTMMTTYEMHIRDLIEQVLFTMQGERVNRPTFGSGLMQLAFAPNSDALATATEFLVQGALQQSLADLIQVHAVDIEHEESILRVTVQYQIRRNQQRQVAQFERGV